MTATTKQKEAEKDHEKRAARHERHVGAFNDTFQRTANAVEKLDSEYQAARYALINSGAVVVTTPAK